MAERKWLTSAVVLSLALALLIFVVSVALAGISQFGEQNIGGSPTMMAANTTLWNSYASFGAGWMFWLIIILAAVGILLLLIYSTEKAGL